jgi:hypothetical protein
MSFRDKFDSSLPQAAITAIDGLNETSGGLIRGSEQKIGLSVRQPQIWAGLVALGAVETELAFLLSGSQESIRALSERAFAHLQRSLVVDVALRERWQEAFKSGEPECEKLGAVHLLLHGIWAFKAHAAGERTDLVYQEKLDLATAARSSEGLVLTEWKKATSNDDAQNKFSEAHAQARLYMTGALGGTELAGFRYLVVVSEKRVSTPENQVEAGVVYRHINIAVEPDPPSREAVRKRGSG